MKSIYIIILILVIVAIILLNPVSEDFQVFDGSIAEGREDVPTFEVLEKDSRYAPYDPKLDPTTVDATINDKETTYETDRIVGSYDDYIKTEDAYDKYRTTIIDEITPLKPDMISLKTKDIPVNYVVKRTDTGLCETRLAVPDEQQDFPVDFNTPRPVDKAPPLANNIRAWYGYSPTFINITIDGPREYSTAGRRFRYVDCTQIIAPFFGLYDYIDLRPVNAMTTGAGRPPNPDKQNIFYMIMEQENQTRKDAPPVSVRMPSANGTFYVEGQNIVAYVPQFSYLNRSKTGKIPYKSVRITEAKYGRDGLWDSDLAPFTQRLMKCGYILDLSRLRVLNSVMRMDPVRGYRKTLVVLVQIGGVVTRYDIPEYNFGSLYLPGPQITIGDSLLKPSLPRQICDYTIRYTITLWIRAYKGVTEPIIVFSHVNRNVKPAILFNELRLYPWGLSFICATQDGQFILNAPLNPETLKSWTHIAIIVNNDGAVMYVNRILKGTNFQMLAPAIWPFDDYDFIVAPSEATPIEYDPRLPLLPAGVKLETPILNSVPDGIEIAKFYTYPMILPLDYIRMKFRTII